MTGEAVRDRVVEGMRDVKFEISAQTHESKKMSDDSDNRRSEADAELEREIRRGRKFTVAEAIGRMAGPGALKGVSPVTRKQQAAVEIENWLRHHLSAGDGELQVVLLQRIKESELLL